MRMKCGAAVATLVIVTHIPVFRLEAGFQGVNGRIAFTTDRTGNTEITNSPGNDYDPDCQRRRQ